MNFALIFFIGFLGTIQVAAWIPGVPVGILDPTKKNPKCGGVKMSRIVGGREAPLYSHNSIVSIAIDGNNGCGGTIIYPEWVLTSAYCAESRDPKKLVVTAGNHIQSLKEETEQVRSVTKVFVHEKYNNDIVANDIALLKVSPAFNYNSKVNQAPLPFKGFGVDEYVTVAGWGATKDRSKKMSDNLKEVELPVIDDLECQRKYPKDIILPGMLCTLKAEGGEDACQGDSGGPAYSSKLKVLAAVISWGEGCGRINKPGVFTEVSHYLGWIRNTTDAN